MKFTRTVLATALAGSMALALSACGNSSQQAQNAAVSGFEAVKDLGENIVDRVTG